MEGGLLYTRPYIVGGVVGLIGRHNILIQKAVTFNTNIYRIQNNGVSSSLYNVYLVFNT